jgi:hypothetical protein
VVPYNPYLTRRYKAHINVEICSSIKAIKYLYKYIYKGPDRTTMRLDSNVDEVQMHLEGRYLSPPERIWRTLEFRMHKEWPPVMRLAIHLPNEQPIYFNKNATSAEIQDRIESARSTLMAFFDYNRRKTDGRQYLYAEFPHHFVFH